MTKTCLMTEKHTCIGAVNIPFTLQQVRTGGESKILQFDSADQTAVAIMHPGW